MAMLWKFYRGCAETINPTKNIHKQHCADIFLWKIPLFFSHQRSVAFFK